MQRERESKGEEKGKEGVKELGRKGRREEGREGERKEGREGVREKARKGGIEMVLHTPARHRTTPLTAVETNDHHIATLLAMAPLYAAYVVAIGPIGLVLRVLGIRSVGSWRL